jgi:hypothetical protein
MENKIKSVENRMFEGTMKHTKSIINQAQIVNIGIIGFLIIMGVIVFCGSTNII